MKYKYFQNNLFHGQHSHTEKVQDVWCKAWHDAFDCRLLFSVTV